MTETIETLNNKINRKMEDIVDMKDYMSNSTKDELKGFLNCLRWISNKIDIDD